MFTFVVNNNENRKLIMKKTISILAIALFAFGFSQETKPAQKEKKDCCMSKKECCSSKIKKDCCATKK